MKSNQRYLFRGKSGDQWVFGCVAYKSGNYAIINDDGQFTIDEDTISQFTGAYDTLGKPIFEWDILEFQIPHVTHKKACVTQMVRYRPESAQFIVNYHTTLLSILKSARVVGISSDHGGDNEQ